MADHPRAALVVEDELQMRKFLRASLISHDFRVLEAGTAREAVASCTTDTPEVILLDLGLPDLDGIELTKQLREWTSVPIIVISARGREEDKVQALDAGADDYLTKPFGIDELFARIRVALRHAARVGRGAEEPVLTFGALVIDLERRHVELDGLEVHLTPIEYKLLTLLAHNAGKVLTHRHILKEVWGPAFVEQPHYVRVRMAELRKKIEPNPARPQLLMTEPGVGYRFRPEPARPAATKS